MLFGAKTMLEFSFSNRKHVFDHMGPGFDGLDGEKMISRFYWSNFHEFISMEMMIGAKTMFKISFSYINHHFDHMGPGFDNAIQ